MLTLVLGAARSGKSEWAELLAKRSQKPVIYIATATADDSDLEWQARLELHKQRRLPHWQTLEVPIALPAALKSIDSSHYVLIDSLGTWLANLISQEETTWQKSQTDLLKTVVTCQYDLTFVAEEVGWGLVPTYELGRIFRDRLGQLNRQLGAVADAVYLVTGGHAINLKLLGEPLPAPHSIEETS